jgi:anaerobic magnesium-protoporphyrin IX monomethyl ester cyclase
MNIVLITPTPPDINAFGVRILSAVLKRAGHGVKCIFLPEGIEHLKFDASFVYQYPEKTLQQIAEICGAADLIGVSFMSLYYDRAVQITDQLKKHVNKPVIWGGTHPTARPEECLDHCDIVCVGEGEEAIVELAAAMAAGKPYDGIRNLCFKQNGAVKKNPSRPPVADLDALPFVDYDIRDHYVYNWRSGDVVALDESIMKEQFLRMPYFRKRGLYAYRTMTSRGCPHRCSYCASSSMGALRRRSVDNVVAELKDIRKRFPYVELISFFDDTFFAAPVPWFEEFRDKYKKEIGLPFHAQCSPATISEAKMELLIDAGLYNTEMGIQTGSERIQQMYRRVVPNQKVIEAAALIQKYGSKLMPPDYHVILDNPWETTQDVRDTLNLLLSLPGRFGLQISSLIFFPGTELNEKARQEGIIKDELNEVCRKPFTFPKWTYLNYLVYLSGLPAVPRGLLKLLAGDGFVNRLHSQEPRAIWRFMFGVTNKLRLILRGLGALFTGDWRRIIHHFKLAR